jgi:hypothetical protein
MSRVAGFALVLVIVGCTPPAATSVPAASEEDALRAIARDIEGLGAEYPQLREFSARDAFDAQRRAISYAFHTHRSQRRAGWATGVPNPDADGIWLHIDFHDPSSTAQIHTQPMTMRRHYGDAEVSFLILEGADTTSCAGAIVDVLRRHGVREGPPPSQQAR